MGMFIYTHMNKSPRVEGEGSDDEHVHHVRVSRVSARSGTVRMYYAVSKYLRTHSPTLTAGEGRDWAVRGGLQGGGNG